MIWRILSNGHWKALARPNTGLASKSLTVNCSYHRLSFPRGKFNQPTEITWRQQKHDLTVSRHTIKTSNWKKKKVSWIVDSGIFLCRSLQLRGLSYRFGFSANLPSPWWTPHGTLEKARGRGRCEFVLLRIRTGAAFPLPRRVSTGLSMPLRCAAATYNIMALQIINDS